ncbi:GTPase-associated protein 1-related protein [Actinoplanes sp. G11-F43]|uniref:GTPase-associated protein 1-related protein n=1 Tax=Actinoplanes sp. G11-F43 TaxID=3424130 RepID=UPI003D356D79
MGLGQLYYTSCRTGIKGFPGFQFNAVTDGVPIDVQRDVESLTAYEPPHSMGTGTDPGRYPVNLCHLPGETTVLASVAFVGEDYSGRSGNYFAHALVTADPGHDLGGRLPIELWRSPAWVTRPVDDTVLPELGQAPPAGPISPDLVADFLAGSGDDHHLAAMLTAAESAIDQGERKLVVIAADSDTVAYWIGALSYLLPPPMARRMSFMTYSRQPRYGRTAVVGALPEVDIERGEAGFAGYHLFDLAADRASEIAVHPLARLLADVGPIAAAELWERAGRYATGTERSFDELYPIVVAATVGWPAGPDRLNLAPLPLVAWLDERGSVLETALFAAVGDATAASLRLTADELGADVAVDSLRRLAATAGDRDVPELTAQAEVALAEVMTAGMARPPDGLRLGTEAGKRVAAGELSRRLPALPAGDLIAYLRWAHRSGLRLDNVALKRAGLATIGPELLTGDHDGPLDVMRAWLPVRQGAVEHLDTAARRDLAAVADRITVIGDLDLDDGEQDACPALDEAVTVAGVRAGQRSPAGALGTVAARRRARGHQPAIDDTLVELLLPIAEWNCEQAIDLVEGLTDEDATEPGVLRRLGDTVLRDDTSSAGAPDGDPDEVGRHRRLCRTLGRSAVLPELPVAARNRIRDLLAADRVVLDLIEAPRTAGFRKVLDQLCERIDGNGTPTWQRYVEEGLLRRHSSLTIHRLTELAVELPGFRRRLITELAATAARDTDLTAARHLWMMRYDLSGRTEPEARDTLREIDGAVLPALKRWRRRDLQQLEKLLGRQKSGTAAAAELAAWADGAGASTVRRVLRVLTGSSGEKRGGKK